MITDHIQLRGNPYLTVILVASNITSNIFNVFICDKTIELERKYLFSSMDKTDHKRQRS